MARRPSVVPFRYEDDLQWGGVIVQCAINRVGRGFHLGLYMPESSARLVGLALGIFDVLLGGEFSFPPLAKIFDQDFERGGEGQSRLLCFASPRLHVRAHNA